MSLDLISDLAPEFQPIVLEGIARAKADGVQINIDSGVRSHKEQADLYKKFLAGGPRAAPPGQSAHEFGYAIDFSVLTGGHRSYSGREFEIARSAFQRAGGHLLALDLDDPGHVEHPQWRTLANLRGRQAASGGVSGPAPLGPGPGTPHKGSPGPTCSC